MNYVLISQPLKSIINQPVIKIRMNGAELNSIPLYLNYDLDFLRIAD